MKERQKCHGWWFWWGDSPQLHEPLIPSRGETTTGMLMTLLCQVKHFWNKFWEMVICLGLITHEVSKMNAKSCQILPLFYFFFLFFLPESVFNYRIAQFSILNPYLHKINWWSQINRYSTIENVLLLPPRLRNPGYIGLAIRIWTQFALYPWWELTKNLQLLKCFTWGTAA